MKLIRVVFLLGVLVYGTGCSKDFCDCFTATRSLKTIDRNTGFFTSVRIEDNINVVLLKDTFCHVTLACGSGIIDHIKTEVTDNRLRLWNNSTCNWVRDLDPQIIANVYYTTLEEISYSATGKVSTEDTLKEQKFTLNVRDGAGSIQLKVNVDTAWFNQHDGATDINLSGKVNAQYIYNNGLGPVNALNLKSLFTFVNNRGTNDCFVQVQDHLEARIEYCGNIYYLGNPQVIISWIEGSGKLLPYIP